MRREGRAVERSARASVDCLGVQASASRVQTDAEDFAEPTAPSTASVAGAPSAPFEADALRVASIGAFVALTLADACVAAFDRFRAAPSAAERARRLQAPLTPRQIESLDRWGYPCVFADFRLHMTLSGPLREPERARFVAAMAALHAPIAAPLVVGAVALFRQE